MNNTEVFAAVADAGSFAMRGHKQRCMSAVEPAIPTEGDLKDEEQDRFLGVPLRRYCPTRSSAHILDSFRRHSWEPGKRMQEEESNYDELSLSLKGLDPEEIDEAMGYPRDPRRTPITCSNDELENLLLMRGEDLEVTQEEQAKRLRAYLSSQNYLYNSLSKSVSMTGIDHCYPDDVSLYSHGQRMTNGLSAVSCGEFGTLETDEKENRIKEESPFGRTLSFIKKMTSGKHKNKEKEKMKEREKDAKDTRYTNGHLFTTISVSGTTMCFVCNKSITAKEALICPTCSVTIHNRCKDSLPSCTKVKQKQQKAALIKNNSALQNVSLRNKTTTLRERPNSAIYPSDSLRHSLLGSRRGRPSLSLSKSVSTTNIAGNLNDESSLGIRRILSQSTDSLNMRNRTLSVESLIDEGADVMYSQLMSDFATDEKEFEADSWSLAVDNNYLQQHKKDVMKRQDVIYELIQTEVHHVRTLKIMTNIFRKGMVEDLQMDPALVQKMFPCVDELSDIHIRFLIQLLERRKDSLASDSNKNFVINKLGDILINQFSGTNAEHMKKSYTEFCSQHQKAVKLYKELFSRDKKFQQLIRKMTRSQLLRRHGVPECILLVTQRITKYPVLIDRILQNSKGNLPTVEALKDVIITIGNEQPITGHQNHTSTSSSNPTYGDSGSVNGSLDKDEDPSQRDRNGNQLQNKSPQEEALQRISNLYNLLHGLQVVVCQQDSLLSLQMPDGTDKKDNLNRSDKKESLSRTNSRDLSVAEPPSKNIDKSGTELTLLQRQHTLLQEELRRCRRQCEERAQESGTLETRLRESEQMRSRLERELEEGKRQLAVLQKGNGLGDMGRSPRGTDPRRRSLPAGDALYQTFTPPQIGHERRSIAAVDGSVPTLTLQEDSDQKDEFSDLTELERLPETAETESSEEEGGGPPISPSSTREFQRMQDIPEEAESVQDLRDAETGSSES
ncbi:rho guanine nucleotide exchange factor 2 [Pyxicephalus adspersus]|uniref:rho guanine nucleotide exchange factor 2 n=1 Tax=Pyxicephalus adspersus TaxID=30357 RepID=UPI003B5A6E1E